MTVQPPSTPGGPAAQPRRDSPDPRLERLMQSLRRYRPADRDALRRFQAQLFGASGRQLEEDRFRWLFEENPYVDPGSPEVWICERGEIVGQQAGIVHRLKIGDEEFQASWAVDLMVDTAWRLRGVGPALSELHTRSHPVVIAMGATDLLYPTLLRTGWTNLGHIPLRVRPLRPAPLRPWWEHRGVRLHELSQLSLPLIWTADRWCDLEILRRGVRVEPVSSFDERLDAVWRLASHEYPVLARRDATAVRWRFDRSCEAGLYRRFLILRGDDPVGYLVLRDGAFLQVPVCFVADYFCPHRLTSSLLAFAPRLARQTNAAAILYQGLHLSAAKAFTRTGFVEFRPRKPRRFLWKTQPELVRLHPALSDRNNWFVTRADGDADHQGGRPMTLEDQEE